MGEKSFPALTEKNVRLALSNHPDPISIPSLLRSFGTKEGTADHGILHTILKKLKDEDFYFTDKSGRMSARKPMSDLLVVSLEKITPRGGELRILNMPDEFPFCVTVSRAEIRNFSRRIQLREGMHLAVHTTRAGGTDLKANIIDAFTFKRSPKISGKFNKASLTGEQPVLKIIGRGVKTEFTTFAAEDITPDARFSYKAAIPHDLNPLKPELELLNQIEDHETGYPIAYIVAEKNSIDIYHSSAAQREAKAATKRKFLKTGRRDFSHEEVAVIDPPYAQDQDDAIKIDEYADGSFRLITFISDVAFYVRSGTVLDQEAQHRALSHYFQGHTIHMLPQILVDHASLNENGEKPVIYVEQYYDADGNQLGKPEVGPGFIAKQKRYTYGEFEDKIISNHPSVSAYEKLGRMLISKMRHEGGIIFDGEKLDTRNPFSQALVSCAMNEANIAMGDFCNDRDEEFLRRSHKASEDPYAFEEFTETLERYGYELPPHIGVNNIAVKNLMDLLEEAEYRHEKSLVENIIRRTILEKAVYTPFDHGHLALKLERYVHGTSPIRRYGDILVQRAIHRICRTPDVPEHARQLTEEMAHHARLMNYGELKSRNAQHDYERFHTIEALARNPAPRANIHDINDMQVQILLPRLGLKKSVPHSSLPHGWRVAPDRRALIFQENVYVRPGTSVLLRIGDVFPSRAEWTIDSMEPKWNGGERLPERFQRRLFA